MRAAVLRFCHLPVQVIASFHSDLYGVTFSGLDLKGADFSRLDISSSRFDKCVLDGASFAECTAGKMRLWTGRRASNTPPPPPSPSSCCSRMQFCSSKSRQLQL
jgi:hypothetical protein